MIISCLYISNIAFNERKVKLCFRRDNARHRKKLLNNVLIIFSINLKNYFFLLKNRYYITTDVKYLFENLLK